MKQRTLGGELRVSEIGYGAMVLSNAYGVADDKKSITLLRSAYDCGEFFFDTADVYGNGHNETLLGQAFHGMREKIIIATKCGFVNHPLDPGGSKVDNSPSYIQQSVDASLKRLNTDYIDLFYLHRINHDVPIEESVGALSDCVQSGKIRYIGLSEASVETIKRANNTHPLSAIQSEYSLWSRDVEKNGVLEICKELNIGFVPFSPLGRGFLTGTIKKLTQLEKEDMRNKYPRFQPGNLEHNLKLVKQLELIANNKKATAAQLALSWLLAQGGFIVPIPGTRNVDRLKQNIQATELMLTEAEINELNQLFDPSNIKGQRYPESLLKIVDQ